MTRTIVLLGLMLVGSVPLAAQDVGDVVNIMGTIIVNGVDDEPWPLSDELVNAQRLINIYVAANQPSTAVEIAPVTWGGECRVEVSGTARIVDSDTVEISLEARLYEGTSESTDDLADREGVVFTVPINGDPANREVKLYNAETGGGDTADVLITVFVRRTSPNPFP
ncbi:MAG: hypothetical protein OXJ54_09875 [Gemmatimonadetes bacterium]|nr:hypothetical protein [Candidatus Palauibacter rhopaloidicola]